MRLFKHVLLPAIALLLVAMPLAESVIADEPPPQATPVSDEEPQPAQSKPGSTNMQPLEDDPTVTLTYDFPVIVNPEVGDSYTFKIMATFPDPDAEGTPHITVMNFGPDQTLFMDVMDGYGEISISTELTERDVTDCDGEGPRVRIQLIGSVEGVHYSKIEYQTIPCSVLNPVYPDISLITQTELCGPNNDEITFAQEGVEYEVDPWSGNETTIHFSAAEGRVLADDAVISHSLTDEGDCITDTPNVPELRYAVCGPGNDIYSEPIQPEHVTMDDSGWIGTERTFTFTAADGYMLPEDFEPTHTVHDVETPCSGNTALEIEEGAFLNRIPGIDVPAGVSFTLEDGHPYVAVQYNIIQQDILLPSGPNHVDVEPGVGGTFSGSMDLDTWIIDGEPLHCQSDTEIKIHGYFFFYTEEPSQPNTDPQNTIVIEEYYPCSVATEVAPITDTTQVEVCGPNNDTFEIAEQPEGVGYTINDWEDGTTTIEFYPEEDYFFWHDPQTVFAFEDAGDPCLESFSVEIEDGAFLDRRYGVPVNIDVTFTLADTHTYDTITILHMQDNIMYGKDARFYTTVEPGVGGSTTVTVPLPSVRGSGTVPDRCWPRNPTVRITVSIWGNTGEVRDDDSTLTFWSEPFPCTWVYEVEPVDDITQVEVCGPNNDTFEIAEQPEGVSYTINDWEDGTTTIEFYPEEDYFFWYDPQTVFAFEDAGDCIAEAPIAPELLNEVCGADNDIISIPTQPVGVIFEDSGWVENERTIEFIADAGYAFPEGVQREYTFTDQDIACPIPTSTLTVQLMTSDGASIEGAPWQLYAPVAAQNVSTEPYAEGTVGAGNSIVVDDLIAGDYRLVVNAEGYEAIDTILTVEDGEESQQVRLDAIALQPAETPTPEPTVEPTTEPTVEPTPEPTVEPTIEATPTQIPTEQPADPKQESAPVTGLPETGSGSGGGFGILALAGLLAAMVLGVIGRRRAAR